MKRVIAPITGFAAVPSGAVAYVLNGQAVLDYLTDGDVPADAMYEAELVNGVLTVLQPLPDGVTHCHYFAGWEEVDSPPAPVEPMM